MVVCIICRLHTMAASVISSDAVEINVIMDDDNEPSTRHPGIQSSDKHTPDKPQRLPFLSQVRSTTPRLGTCMHSLCRVIS